MWRCKERKRKKTEEDYREANWQIDAEEEEEVFASPPSGEDSGQIEEIVKTIEAQDEEEKGEEDEEELEENFEGDFLGGRTQHVIPPRYKSDSD